MKKVTSTVFRLKNITLKPWQFSESVAFPEHGEPSMCPRVRDLVPTPQSVEQDPQSPHVDHEPSTMKGVP